MEAVKSFLSAQERLVRYIPQIGFLRRDEHPCLALTLSESRTYRFGFDDVFYCGPDEARATGDEDDGRHVGHDKVRYRELRVGRGVRRKQVLMPLNAGLRNNRGQSVCMPDNDIITST